MGWLGWTYLLLILAADICMAYFIIRLIGSRSIEEGRAQIRRLYLTWGMLALALIVSNLI
jgi:geranylgeranylglycerol-phosphate geranylgeranyltransferase